jgi:hypothetical protein
MRPFASVKTSITGGFSDALDCRRVSQGPAVVGSDDPAVPATQTRQEPRNSLGDNQSPTCLLFRRIRPGSCCFVPAAAFGVSAICVCRAPLRLPYAYVSVFTRRVHRRTQSFSGGLHSGSLMRLIMSAMSVPNRPNGARTSTIAIPFEIVLTVPDRSISLTRSSGCRRVRPTRRRPFQGCTVQAQTRPARLLLGISGAWSSREWSAA